MFSDPDFRTQLLQCHTEEEFKIVLEEHTRSMVERMSHMDEKVPSFDNDNVSTIFALIFAQEFIKIIPIHGEGILSYQQ